MRPASANSSRRREIQHGFSLLEVLVALVIMAMSLSVLYQTLGGSVRGVTVSDERTRASLIAESLFSMYEVVPPEGVNVSGVSDGRFAWSVVSEPSAVQVETPAWELHRLTVEVASLGSDRERVLRLWTLRPVRQQP